MIDHILLDECLSPSLGAVAQDRGVDAIHTSYLGMSRWADWSVARFAIEHDYIVATNNRADFLREYAKLDLHAGLVVIVPSARRERQKGPVRSNTRLSRGGERSAHQQGRRDRR